MVTCGFLFPCARKTLEGHGRSGPARHRFFSTKQPSLSDAVVTSLLRHGRVIFIAMKEPEPRDGRTVAFWLAMLVPLGLMAIVAAVVYAIGRLLGG
jgi:hypothetical protein